MDRAKLDARIKGVIGRHGALVRTQHLLDAGIHPRDIYELRDSGQLEAVARGLYRLRSAPLPEHFDLVLVAARVPRAAICLISALSFHDLTDEIPHEVSIAIPRSCSPPKITELAVRVFRFSDASFELGIEHHDIAGIDVKVYSAERTVVDAFRFRNRIGDDVAIGALTRALRNRKLRPGKLLELAGKLRTRRVIEPYLKAVT